MKKTTVIFVALSLLTFIMAGCSHDSPAKPREMKPGAIFFLNESPTSLVLSRYVQTHDGRTSSQEVNRSVYVHSRYQLTNLFDGTRTFPGGDRVAVYFYAPSYNPYDPTPEYTGDIAFTVDGQTIVKVIGRGMYDLSGD
jgi:hypothetical protein